MSSVIIFILTVIVIYILSLYWQFKRTDHLLSNIPSPPGLFYLGHALYFKGPEKILEMYEKYVYDGLAKFTVFWYHSISITDYKYAEEILSKTTYLHKSDEYRYFESWLGTGLLTSGPEKWKKTRKIITPTFHFQILEEFIDVFHSCGEIMIDKLKQEVGKEKTNIYNYVSLCTLDVICESAMGTKVDAQLNSESKYIRSVKDLSVLLCDKMFSPMKMIKLFYILSGDYAKEKKALKVVHDYTESVIYKRREELKRNEFKSDTVSKKRRLAFLDLLLQSTIDGRPMTDYEIRQEVDTFMFEGHDTTTSAICSTFYCLSLHQDIQNKVVQEIQNIFGIDKERAPTYDDLQNMRYLEMVIKEALRLYPPVPFYARKVEKDTKCCDITIPKDVTVNLFAWGLHRNPKLFPDPEKFDPERFTLQNQNTRGPFSYIAFSAGPRNCIGQRFAILEMKSVISKVLRNFEILPVDGFKPIWVPDVVLKSKNGIEICLRDRMH